MKNMPLPRLDQAKEIREHLLQFCRLRPGQVWNDPTGEHRVGCLDATDSESMSLLLSNRLASLAIHDPPYNLVAFEEKSVVSYIAWCKQWIENTHRLLSNDSSLYVWMGADQTNHFQPLPDFMLLMRDTPFNARSFITMRNQRGYGTQRNWMAVRQELLYYVRGTPGFNVEAEYTDIPKILRGYYKTVDGNLTENSQRSKSQNIRAGNVWVDVQQVFYRLIENVNGCYAQKPMKSIDRIIRASSKPGDVVVDFFAHSGTTLMCCEVLRRRCCTCDIDPIFCEITIRRLEHYRKTGLLGWQNGNPFESEIGSHAELQALLGKLAAPSDECPLLAVS